jgi:hypothetical protein
MVQNQSVIGNCLNPEISGKLSDTPSTPHTVWRDPLPAPHRVWRGTSFEPVKWVKISRDEVRRMKRDLSAWKRVTYQRGRGKHGGDVADGTMKVFHALTGFYNYETGCLCPSRQAIADRAQVALSTVDTALNWLWDHRVIEWTRRGEKVFEDGRCRLKQKTNAYWLNPPERWLGRRGGETPHRVQPHEWGKAAVMPDVHLQAIQSMRGTPDRRETLRLLRLGEPHSVEAALARLGATMMAETQENTGVRLLE